MITAILAHAIVIKHTSVFVKIGEPVIAVPARFALVVTIMGIVMDSVLGNPVDVSFVVLSASPASAGSSATCHRGHALQYCPADEKGWYCDGAKEPEGTNVDTHTTLFLKIKYSLFTYQLNL
jgi:hypothetical protein